MAAGLIIMAGLLMMEARRKDTHLYAWYLLLYGIVRFLLNGFRYGLEPFVGILPNGHFWAIVSAVIGFVWLICVRKISAKQRNT